LSSTTFCFFASSAFDGAAFFGGILPRGSDSRCREGRVGFGSGRREEEAAARGGEEGFVGLGLLVRKGMAEARRKFLETVEVTWRCEEAGGWMVVVNTGPPGKGFGPSEERSITVVFLHLKKKSSTQYHNRWFPREARIAKQEPARPNPRLQSRRI